jgi:hypothetical protein
VMRVAGAWEFAGCAADAGVAAEWSKKNFVRNRVLQEVINTTSVVVFD